MLLDHASAKRSRPVDGEGAPASDDDDDLDDGLENELDEAWPAGAWPLSDKVFSDNGDGETLPATSPASPDVPRPQPPGRGGTACRVMPSLGVERICGVDASTVKRPLELEWSRPLTSPAEAAATDPISAALGESVDDFFTRRAAEWFDMHPAACPEIVPAHVMLDERIAWIASRLGISPAAFRYAVNYDYRHIERFAALCVQEDDGSLLDPQHPPHPGDALTPLPAVQGPAERAAPAAYVDEAPTRDLPARFRGTFNFYSMFKDREAARRKLEAWQRQTLDDAATCFAALRAGRKPSVKSRKPLVFLPKDFHPALVGRHINCSNHDACFVESVHDREPCHARPDGEHADQIDWARVAADLGEAFPDREFLHELRYGHDSKSKQPWCLVLCSMNRSAADNLPLVVKAIDSGIAKGWQTSATSVPAVPAVFEPFGIAYKKHSIDPATRTRKPRLTTDKSGPRDVTDDHGRPLADNDNIDLADHPETKLVRASDIRGALGVLTAIVQAVLPAVRASAPSEAAAEQAAAALEVDIASDDMQAYFSQFAVRHRNISRNGIVLPRENGTLTYSFSRRVQFGGKSSPAWAMRMTNAILFRLNRVMDDEERRFAADAHAYERGLTGGSAVAASVSPKPLRDLLARKRAELGPEHARPFWCAGYSTSVGTTQTPGPHNPLARRQNQN